MTIVDTRRRVIVALMGPTGTGKSTFIKLLTKDDNIHIGHNVESETIDVSTASYSEADHLVTLVDTPGFDDSREGVTDTDILGKIADFLQEGEGRKLDGIIYLHRISDPRMGGSAKKNLRMFRELCGDENLPKVRIVTTGWNVVKEKEGNVREAALRNSAFKPLIDLGAMMLRQDKEEESARHILSTLIKNEPPMTVKFQKELNEGKALGDTSAGAVIIEEMLELRKEHDKEMEELRKVIEQATMENVDELRAEVAAEHRDLEELKARNEDDKKKLSKTRMARPTVPADNSFIQMSSKQSRVHSQSITNSRRHFQDQGGEYQQVVPTKAAHTSGPTKSQAQPLSSKGGAETNAAAKGEQDPLVALEERQLQRPTRERTPDEETPMFLDERVQHTGQSNRRNGGESDNHIVWFFLFIWSRIVACFTCLR